MRLKDNWNIVKNKDKQWLVVTMYNGEVLNIKITQRSQKMIAQIKVNDKLSGGAIDKLCALS
jgi:hypothetical protein